MAAASRPRWIVPVVAVAVAACLVFIGWRLAATRGASAPALSVAKAPHAGAAQAPHAGTAQTPQAATAQAPLAAPSTAPAGAAAPTTFGGFRASVVRFATVDEGRAAVSADDDWIAATSEAQRASLMGVKAGATREAFRRFQAGAVVPWSDAARARMQRALEQVAPAFNRLGIRLPAEVLLVQTNGRESAATPHTRGRAVMFPVRFDQQDFGDAELMAHELWHVVSRHNPALRTRLYAALGFIPCAPLQWPAAWLALRLANQDAPHHEHLMWAEVGGRLAALMPVVVADPAELRNGGTIVTAAQTRLLEVIPGSAGRPTQAVLRKGQPVWHDPEETPAYLEKLGGNSDYLVHPEETLADNVMFLVSGRPVPNPALLARIEAALRGP